MGVDSVVDRLVINDPVRMKYEDAMENRCEKNSSLIMKLILEAIAILVIIILLVVDIRKYTFKKAGTKSKKESILGKELQWD